MPQALGLLRACRLAILGSCLVGAGCFGPSGRPIPVAGDSSDTPPREQFILREPYTAGVMGAEHLLPAGVYEADGRDDGGIYFRAPSLIQRRGLFGGVLPGPDSAVEGGIYVRDGNPFPWIVWLWIRKPDGSIRTDPLPGNFSSGEGKYWNLQVYQPLPTEKLRP